MAQRAHVVFLTLEADIELQFRPASVMKGVVVMNRCRFEDCFAASLPTFQPLPNVL